MIKRVILWTAGVALFAIALGVAVNWELIQRTALGGLKVYETQPPAVPDLPRPAVLVFSKTNGFRDDNAIRAANVLFKSIARESGWGYFQTENGAAFTPEILSKFDGVVFNNVSGDVFTPVQRAGLKSFIERGGGFVGVHGSGGDPSYDWKWYVNELIGAQFKGHTLNPQFQPATVITANDSHPAMAGLPKSWRWTDEWYSFESSPAKKGYHVFARVDESTYSPKWIFGDLRMGDDHPVIWWHCQGRGRVFYSALGHRPEAYAEPTYQGILRKAIAWTIAQDGSDCIGEIADPKNGGSTKPE